jgi:hypothetical protein
MMAKRKAKAPPREDEASRILMESVARLETDVRQRQLRIGEIRGEVVAHYKHIATGGARITELQRAIAALGRRRNPKGKTK